MDFPQELLHQMEKGNVVLFLGSGASKSVVDAEGHTMPDARQLSGEMVKRFLDDSYQGESLATVADLAMSVTDLFTVQNFIYERLIPFKAADFHKIIPTFKWKSIYTTNYDKIIEDAYRSAGTRIQELSPVYRNTRADQIFRYPNSLPYYKLHGCLDCINDLQLPLILTPDQYVTHRVNRDHLFNKLMEESFNHPILFVGYSFGDSDIRAIMNLLDQEKEGRIRSYLVGPGVRPAEVSLYESKKITSIKATFQEFLVELNKKISVNVRQLGKVRPILAHPIHEQFVVSISDVPSSPSFEAFIENDIEYVNSAMSSPNTDAKEFYKGYFENWDPIIKNLDVKRTLLDEISSEVFLDDHYNNENSGQFVFVIKGYAGAGKSVFLKRLAWAASVDFGCFCIFYKGNTAIRYLHLAELYSYTKRRIYIFVDNLMEKEDEIISLIEKAKKDKLPLTIVGAVRTNIWNSENNDLQKFATTEYALHYLNTREIDGLLTLLERHRSLGFLANKSLDERRKALEHQAGKELLVALYEATNGKPFPQIIKDEFDKIGSSRAKSLYMTVSILHRLNSVARAGLISRVHGINFDLFQKELFLPLEYIVFTRRDYKINDYVYLTRHPHIAEMVFETVLTTQQERHDEYVRVLSYLDTDFDSDRNAFIAMTNAKKLIEVISDTALIRNIFYVAETKNPNNSKLIQQQAIFEAEKGDINKAEQLIKSAYKLNENDQVILHTFSELEYKKAERSSNRLEKEKYYRKTISLAEDQLKRFGPTSYLYHTNIKAYLGLLEASIEEDDQINAEKTIKDVEKKFRDAKQFYPFHEFILEAESRYNQILKNNPAALELLEKAFSINKSSPFLATRLARLYEQNGNLPKALETLNATLLHLPGDKDINFEYARLYMKAHPNNLSESIYYWRRSFIEGDNRYQAQFWYARTLYLTNDLATAKAIFLRLGKAPVDPVVKLRPSGMIEENGKPKMFTGTIGNKEASYAFIKRDAFGDDIFFYRPERTTEWTDISRGDRVSFNLGFNYKGPVAVGVQSARV